MLAINVESVLDQRHHWGTYSKHVWVPAELFPEAAWALYQDMTDRPAGCDEMLTGSQTEILTMLESKYSVPGVSCCMRVPTTLGEFTHSGLTVPCYFVCKYPVYAGDSFGAALEISTRINKLLVHRKIIPKDNRPGPDQRERVTVFMGAYGCDYVRDDEYVFLWYDPKRALRFLNRKAKRATGLLAPRKLSVDYYKLLMQCLNSIAHEYTAIFKLPKTLPDTLQFTRKYIKIVAKRARFKDDPAESMQWIHNCREMYRLLDGKAFKRLGHCPPEAYARSNLEYMPALRTMIDNEQLMRKCVLKYFPTPRIWDWMFKWVRKEYRRLQGAN